jgi:signal transduction histidine kinase
MSDERRSLPPSTRARRKARGRKLVKAALVLLMGALIGLALWDPLRLDERSHVEHVTKLAVRSLQADITADLESEILAVIRLAKLATFEHEAWQSNAKLFLADHPSYVALFWADPSYHITSTILHDGSNPKDLDPATDSSLKPALESALELGHRQLSTGPRTGRPSTTPDSDRNQKEATLSPAFRMANGEWGCRIVVPVHEDERLIGFLVAVFDVRKALDSILADHSELGYAVAVFEGGDELYRMHGVNDGQFKFAQETDVRLRSADWRIRVWPERELLAEIESKLPEVTLVIGALLGVLLVLTVHFARRAQANSRELQRAHDDMEVRVEERTAEVHELSGRLLQSQDEERRRIARELHDSTTQVLAGVAFYLDKANSLATKESRRAVEGDGRELQEALDESTKFLEQAAGEVRTISYLLHPPMLDDLGLDYVVRWFAAGFSQRSGVAVELDLQPNLGRFPGQLELALFRIVQEALTNVHRHSGSATAEIRIVRDHRRITLEVSDQGCGMPDGAMDVAGSRVAALGVGIRGMRERVRQLGGVLTIESSRNLGTTVRAVLPVAGPKEAPSPSRDTQCESRRTVGISIR